MPLNIFDGSSWNPLKKVQIHDGTSWNESKAAYIWDGSEWKSLLDLKPKNTELPALSLQEGVYLYAAQETVSVSNGIWENSPTSFKYQWQKSPFSSSSYNWSDITGKTSNTLLLDEDEWSSSRNLKYVGYVVRCKVTATNAAGDNDPAVYTIPSPIIAPQKLSVLSASVISNGVVKIDWQKPIGANDFYIQYQGPEVAFTETQSLGDVDTLTIDTGSSGGTLGILINPKNNSNASGMALTGLGKNASISDLKPNKPYVTTTMESFSWGGRLRWTNTLINQTSWVIYNNGQLYASSFLNDPSATSFDIDRFGEGGSTFGSFTITVTGTAPRFTETSWPSTPPLSIVYPAVPLPVNQVAPTVSTSNGRVFASTTGTWSNTSSIYSYLYEWFANGSPIDSAFITESDTINLYDTTQYDNMSITSAVYVLTTDLRTTSATASSNSAQSNPVPPTTYTIPNLIGTYNPSDTTNYNISNGSTLGTTDYTKEGQVYMQSPGAGASVSTSPKPTITVYRYVYEAAPQYTYYAGYSACNNNNGAPYIQEPSVSGPYTGSSIPQDISTGPSTYREVIRYRTTSAAALSAAAQAGCETPVFAPPAFAPAQFTIPNLVGSTELNSGIYEATVPKLSNSPK